MTLPKLIDIPYVPIHSNVYCFITVYIMCTKIKHVIRISYLSYSEPHFIDFRAICSLMTFSTLHDKLFSASFIFAALGGTGL